MLNRGHLYAFGSNGSGQLGLDHQDDISTPVRCQVAVEVGDEPPVTIAAGGNHTLLLFASGVVCAAGENKDGRCGTAHSNGFHRISFSATDHGQVNLFRLCSATWEGTFLITNDDKVYSCGTGLRGELGLGEGVVLAPTPQCIVGFPPAGTEIVQIASSVSHSAALLSNGDVYGWGNGRKGQLGEPSGMVWQPRKINGITFDVSRVCCGRDFTLFAGAPDDGQYAIYGSNRWLVGAVRPKLIRGWNDITANWGSIHVMFKSGQLTSWGRNDYGQLAPVTLPPSNAIAAGSEHTLVRTVDNKLIARGWGEHGNCGPQTNAAGDTRESGRYISLDGCGLGSSPTIEMIGAGCATSWAWLRERQHSDRRSVEL